MDLTTRCPQCLTEFPVSLQQLQLRKGYIRCVNCAHIFDAYEAVVPSGADPVASGAGASTPLAPVEPQLPATAEPTPSNEPRFIVSAESAPASGRNEPGVPIRTRASAGGSPSHGEPAAFTLPDTGHGMDEAGRHTVPDAGHGFGGGNRHTIGEPGLPRRDDAHHDAGAGLYIEPSQGREAGPEFVHRDERSGLGLGGVAWSLVVLLGVAAALLQAAYIYRVHLASEFPRLRPALERYCETLGCTVDYPRRIAQIAIMDSSLQAVRNGENTKGASADAHRMMLNVVLRNNYDKPQQWPTLSVELVDFSGTVAVRRLLAPSDYLPELSREQPFPAKSEVRVTVPISVQGVQINGYQLDRFFP